MTEQEYCDLSDLQICRAMLSMVRTMNCFEEPNKTRYESVKNHLSKMIEHLEPKVQAALDKDG